jgi:hypothetical protein
MAISTIDKSQRTAARIAGLAFPISFATVVAVNFGIFARLIVSGNPAETARNILAHETLFRVGIAGDMVYCVGVVVLLTALYVISSRSTRTLPCSRHSAGWSMASHGSWRRSISLPLCDS